MAEKGNIIIAETHTAEYLIHKYWARKPHNVIRHYITKHFKKGDIVCDPFFGSGIFLIESKKYNINTVGFDINPTAFEIANFSLFPPDKAEFEKEFFKIYNILKAKYSSNYLLEKNTVKYLVHLLEYNCPNCSSITVMEQKFDKCPNCKNKLFGNLEYCKSSKVIEAILNDGKVVKLDNDSNFNKPIHSKISDIFKEKPLINRRILAFPNMTLGDFFSTRAQVFISEVEIELLKIKDEKIREALTFFFASCLIQFSKLIPYRNNLDTGGPAWSIPGFWVAQKHLESNPFFVIEGRIKKFIKAIDKLKTAYTGINTNCTIENISFEEGLSKYPNEYFDGLFFDPPYGGDVPYLEFSFLWNSFYKKSVTYDKEVIVSDRTEISSDWSKYNDSIQRAIFLLSEKIKNTGKVILTFNNLNPQAWEAIITNFAKCKMIAIESTYQIPAVISSKAQKAKNTSYVGDYYIVFEKNSKEIKLKINDKLFFEKLIPCIFSRGKKIAKNIIHRHVILTVIRNNLSTCYIREMEEYLNKYVTECGEYYEIKNELIDDNLFANYSIEKAIHNILSNLKREIIKKKEAQLLILQKTENIGLPTFAEIDNYIASKYKIKGDNIILNTIDLFSL